MTPDDPRHGTPAGWVAHYTHQALPACAPCLAANTRYNKTLRLEHHRGVRRRVPVTGTRRRIQALARMGWPARDVARLLGISQQALHESIAPDRQEVTRARHDAVAALYDTIAYRRGPSARVAKMAENRGWASPAAWDDIDTDPAPQGHRVCTAPGCAGEHLALGLCSGHYYAAVRANRRQPA